MARDLDGTGRASLQDDRHPTDGVCGTKLQLDVAGREPGPESVMVEVNIGNTAASGPEHLLPSAEIPEQERKRRRPRGGKQSRLTGEQKRACQNERDTRPEKYGVRLRMSMYYPGEVHRTWMIWWQVANG